MKKFDLINIMKSIKSLRKIKGVKFLVRVDFNVPVKDGVVVDDFRIRKALPTIKRIAQKGGKVILISHLGRSSESLLPVYKTLNKYIDLKFVPDIVGEEAVKAVGNMQDTEVLLLENLRSDMGEKRKDKIFAVALSNLADVYVNEAFSVSHRKDSSIVLLPKILPSYIGLQFETEVKELSRVFNNTKKPFLFMLGGAKFSTKLPLIEKYLKIADYVFMGGALFNDLLDTEGYQVGRSLVDDAVSVSESIIENKKLLIPFDVRVLHHGELVVKRADKIKRTDTIIDMGDGSIEKLAFYIKKAKLIVWNGPFGKYEDRGGDVSTNKILELVASSKAKSVIGGGDTVGVISKLGMEDKFDFVSTGGGAMVEFLTEGTLPGIEALK